MDSLFQRARELAQETAKMSQEFAKEAAKMSQEIALETAKRSKELALEATKKADQLKAFAAGEISQAEPAAASETELEAYGITPELREFVKSLKIKTFREYPSKDLDEGRQDLTEWQEKHAVLLLRVAPEISDFRYVLCPRRMKESRFWKIYYKLVENFIAPFEARANLSSSSKEEIATVLSADSSSKKKSIEHDLDAFILGLDDVQGEDGSDYELDQLISGVDLGSDEEEQDRKLASESSSDVVLVEVPSETDSRS